MLTALGMHSSTGQHTSMRNTKEVSSASGALSGAAASRHVVVQSSGALRHCSWFGSHCAAFTVLAGQSSELRQSSPDLKRICSQWRSQRSSLDAGHQPSRLQPQSMLQEEEDLAPLVDTVLGKQCNEAIPTPPLRV